MNIVGFFFTKVHAHKASPFKKGLAKTTNIDVLNVEKENAPFTTSNQIAKVDFRYQVAYTDSSSKKDNSHGEVTLEGTITLMMNEKESKDLLNDWKKKEVPTGIKQGLFNFILRKCSAKSLELEDSVNLPFHIPIPQVKLNTDSSKSK